MRDVGAGPLKLATEAFGWAVTGVVGHACDVFRSTQPGKFSQQGLTLITQMMRKPFKKA